MSKINLEHNNIEYTLEYDRNSIKIIEANGFELDKFTTQPMSMIELAFAGAFIKHHKKIKQSIIDEIFESCPKKSDLIQTISTMITDCYNWLADEPDAGESKGNVSWEVVE